MAKPAARIAVLEALLGIGALAFIGWSFNIQVIRHGWWAARAKALRTETAPVTARRGSIYDRHGVELAESQELYRVGIALNELRDTAAVRDRLPAMLGLPRERVMAAFANSYAYFYGPFTAAQVQPLIGVRGVHFDVYYDRVYPMQSLAASILGHLDSAGEHGIEGIEKSADSLLAGHPGLERFTKDGKGARIAAPGVRLREPVAGRDLYLTIDHDLQGIAEGELRRAVDTLQAHGGAVVIVDIHSGELLAVASLSTDSSTGRVVPSAAAIVEPYEPGSTSKLFTAAAVLRAGTDTGPVSGEGGKWLMPMGKGKPRTIEDEHKIDGPVTLGDAIKYSSNIAMSKLSLFLHPAQQFEALRDFGFGTYAGLDFPGETPGVLRRPALWENARYSMPSLAQGYEWMTSAVQMATAYAAIGNGGTLLAPSLVREVRDTSGHVVWLHRADTVRQAVSPEIAQQLIAYLRRATDSGGTGSRAQLDRFSVVGKTGTAVLKTGAHYGGGNYRASFAGLFPGDAPEWVVYVMIDRPRGARYFGGLVAAPMVRTMLQQALASPQNQLDRRHMPPSGAVSIAAQVAGVTDAPPAPADQETVHRLALPLAATAAADQADEVVPSLAGSAVRDAILTLHQLGFEARLVGHGTVKSTTPAAGESLARGATVTLHADSTP